MKHLDNLIDFFLVIYRGGELVCKLYDQDLTITIHIKLAIGAYSIGFIMAVVYAAILDFSSSSLITIKKQLLLLENHFPEVIFNA